ncbi:MAG: histidine kinase [Polyangiales bacterium]
MVARTMIAPVLPPRPTVTTITTEPTLASRAKHTAVGVLVAVGLIAIPLLTRAAFGVLQLRHVAVNLLTSLFLLAMVMGAMTTVFHIANQRRRNELVALGLAAVAGAVVSGLACLPLLPFYRRYPEIFQTIPGEPTTFTYFVSTAISDSLFISLLWAALLLYPSALRSMREHERALDEARTEAELLRLRSHLEPHFVLNTLNAIAGMVVHEPRAARSMLGALGDLFRDATSDRTSEHHTLESELGWLERYASIAQGRYGDALRFEWEATDEARAMLLPRLLLQPIVENAIQHGALRRESGGLVRLRAYVRATTLVCDITDNGPGPPDGPRREGARGLAIVERRLALEAPGSTFSLRRSDEQTLARLEVAQPQHKKGA